MIIDVAAALFATEGLRGTTMETIATAAGRGRRTVYMHFRNKAEVYEAVVTREIGQIITPLRSLAQSGAPLEEVLPAYGRERAWLLDSLARRNPLLIRDFALGHSRIERLRSRLHKCELQVLTPLFRRHPARVSDLPRPEDFAVLFLNMLTGNDMLLTKKDGLSEAIHLASLSAEIILKALPSAGLRNQI